MNSFSNSKNLRFVITLGTGKFGSSNNNQITLEGYRASVNIDKAGGMMMGQLNAQIFGMTLADMNSVTTLRYGPIRGIVNHIDVYAIDGTQQTLVFTGDIINAWADFSGQPEVFLTISAQSTYGKRMTPAPVRSYKGQVDVASIMASIAQTMGYSFENAGVNGQITNPYLHGSLLDQALALAKAANIWMFIDNNTLAISKPNTPRKGLIPLLSPNSGTRGYPTFDGTGITLTCLFSPALQFGGAFKVDTSLPQAQGEWIAISIAYQLQSQTDGGAWFATVKGNKNGFAIVS